MEAFFVELNAPPPLRGHPLETEVCERNVRSGFRVLQHCIRGVGSVWSDDQVRQEVDG